MQSEKNEREGVCKIRYCRERKLVIFKFGEKAVHKSHDVIFENF